MNELIRELVSLRIQEEAEHIRIHGKSREVLTEEGLLFYVDTDHYDVISFAVTF